MGFTPQQVNDMSVFQWMAVCDGYARANAVDDGSLSKSEQDDLWSWMQSKEK